MQHLLTQSSVTGQGLGWTFCVHPAIWSSRPWPCQWAWNFPELGHFSLNWTANRSYLITSLKVVLVETKLVHSVILSTNLGSEPLGKSSEDIIYNDGQEVDVLRAGGILVDCTFISGMKQVSRKGLAYSTYALSSSLYVWLKFGPLELEHTSEPQVLFLVA